MIIEKRATLDQTPMQHYLRPTRTGANIENLRLAGDWIDHALPATIETAIFSGKTAIEDFVENSFI